MSLEILQFFVWDHLPEDIAKVSQPFQFLAMEIFNGLPDNKQREMAFIKLLEAKDCAVRALIHK